MPQTDLTPSILFRDEHFVAVHKPAGLLVHRSPIDRRETRFALQLVRNLIGQRVYPVHRLDKPTSGVLIFGLHTEAARRLAALFAAGEVAKSYLTVVRGILPEAGTIDHPLIEEEDDLGYPLKAGLKGAQAAITDFRRLAAVELPVAVGRYATSRYSLALASPRTGRRHQLRRHFKHLCHPIIGDTRYGEGRHNRFFRDAFGCHRLLLAATTLAFRHPFGGQPLTLAAPPAADFRRVCSDLGWEDLNLPAEARSADGL